MERLEPLEMLRLRGAGSLGRRIARPAGRVWARFGDHERLAMIESKPGLPLGVGKGYAGPQRLAERRQFTVKVGMFGDQGALLPLVCSRPAHVANQVNHAVAFGDVGVELVERIAAEVLEVFLHLHRNVLSGEVAAQLIPISSEFVGNGRKEDHDRHGVHPS